MTQPPCVPPDHQPATEPVGPVGNPAATEAEFTTGMPGQVVQGVVGAVGGPDGPATALPPGSPSMASTSPSGSIGQGGDGSGVGDLVCVDQPVRAEEVLVHGSS